MTQLVSGETVVVVSVGDLLHLGGDVLLLGTQLESLGVGLGSLTEDVTFHGRLGHVHEGQDAGFVEVDIHVGELLFLKILVADGHVGDRHGLLLEHQGKSVLVNTGGDAGRRIGVGFHVSLGQLDPSSGLGSLLGVLGSGQRFVNALLHLCIGFLGIGKLQGASQCECEN